MKHLQPRLERLGAYPFERLRRLLADVRTETELTPIIAGEGEPRLPQPAFVRDTILAHLEGFSRYPATKGISDLRIAIADWLMRRYALDDVCPNTQVLAANGTREALFAAAHAWVNPDAFHQKPFVLMPNPMYQIYLGGAITAGATPFFMPCTQAGGFAPDIDAIPESVWQNTALIYVCSPSNPTGWVADAAWYTRLLDLADRYDFYILADECYSEIYPQQPPTGLLEVAQQTNRSGFSRCLVFNSLSKRSALPGLRSGFIAGDAALIARFAKLRSYTGPATPLPLQHVAVKAWQDETHVTENRRIYQQSLAAFFAAYGQGTAPEGGFFAWLQVADDEAFTRAAYVQQAVTILPGRYLGAKDQDMANPGLNFVRIALVDGSEKAAELGHRLRDVHP